MKDAVLTIAVAVVFAAVAADPTVYFKEEFDG